MSGWASAAIRHKAGGHIICGPRHFDHTMREQIRLVHKWGYGNDEWEQGFVDQHCRFLTRKEAFVIAENNGQIIKVLGSEHRGALYSENLY